MSVVDLSTGKTITEAPEAPTLVNALKGLVKRIEDGTLKVGGFYLIAEAGEQTYSFDNGLTAGDAITILEREKFRILCMLEGVKAS